MKRIFFVILLSSVIWQEKAFSINTLQVSLLTVMPRPNKVYTIYGHSALRLYNPAKDLNLVFNWGTFNFNSPYFLYHFIKGETDYFLSYTSYEHFIYEYAQDTATIIEQILNLNDVSKKNLMRKLSENVQPENLIYRYNFLFDNCTTKVRDLIMQSCDSLSYPLQTKTTSFRELIHSCTKPYPWITFWIDLIIGTGADSVISSKQELFLPEKLMQALDKTSIVLSKKHILISNSKTTMQKSQIISPLLVGWIIFLTYLIIIIWREKKHLSFNEIFFAPLFLMTGISGCIIAFIVLFSYHPCTSPNWNLLWLHPFHLIAFTGYFFNKANRFITGYHIANFVFLCWLLLKWNWLPQDLNKANIPYILCLIIASFSIIIGRCNNHPPCKKIKTNN